MAGRSSNMRAGKRRSVMSCAYSNKERGSVACGPVGLRSPTGKSGGAVQPHAAFSAPFSLSSCGSSTTRASSLRRSMCMATGQSSLGSSYIASPPQSPSGVSSNACNGGLSSCESSGNSLVDYSFQAGCASFGSSHPYREGSGKPEGGPGGPVSEGDLFSGHGARRGDSCEMDVAHASDFDMPQTLCLAPQARSEESGAYGAASAFPLDRLCHSLAREHETAAHLTAAKNIFGLDPSTRVDLRGRVLERGLSSCGEDDREVSAGEEEENDSDSEAEADHGQYGVSRLSAAGGTQAVSVVDTLQALLKAAEDVFSMGATDPSPL
ncbi:protein kinase [Besnoitia besnoiti]|uniref:Protein kinase n=1 Tax=Besnoitia besnoiti TaxID=94643 RepID=A0A2A9MBN0_BESBE|nr:protein kinase [Besnoitia besnoiti]PFH33027.1 protein kinase [Besnoitia besnoiti]